MRVLVTGGAGAIGSHVCEALLARGDDVAVLDAFHDFYPRALKERNLDALPLVPICEAFRPSGGNQRPAARWGAWNPRRVR